MWNIDLLLGQTELACQLFPLSWGEIFLHNKITLQSAHLLCGEAGPGLFPIKLLPRLGVLLEAEDINNEVRSEGFLFPRWSPVQRGEALTSILTEFLWETIRNNLHLLLIEHPGSFRRWGEKIMVHFQIIFREHWTSTLWPRLLELIVMI